jgi:hypothetical protein
MRDLGLATEDAVVLAFVQAKIDSARFGAHYAAFLSHSGLERGSIVDQPNLQSEWENRVRRELLTAVRGYGNRTFLFNGFPQNVTWRRVAIEVEDADKLKYANYDTWVQLSGGSRLVVDGAKRIDAIKVGENANENIKAVADDLRAGKRYPSLIAVESEGGLLILVEGHIRATAYVLARIAQPIEIFVGSSPKMKL